MLKYQFKGKFIEELVEIGFTYSGAAQLFERYQEVEMIEEIDILFDAQAISQDWSEIESVNEDVETIIKEYLKNYDTHFDLEDYKEEMQNGEYTDILIDITEEHESIIYITYDVDGYINSLLIRNNNNSELKYYKEV